MLNIGNLDQTIDLTEDELRDVHGGFFGKVVSKAAELASAPTYGEIIAEALEKAKKDAAQ